MGKIVKIIYLGELLDLFSVLNYLHIIYNIIFKVALENNYFNKW